MSIRTEHQGPRRHTELRPGRPQECDHRRDVRGTGRRPEHRVAALRHANVYERQRYRHMVGFPKVLRTDGRLVECQVPFLVVRIVQDDETFLYATGIYKDLVEVTDERLLFRRRVVICDSRRFDTLLAVPL